MSSREYLVGQQLGNYYLEALIDSGSFGTVYRGWHYIFTDDQPVALKLMHNYLDRADREHFFQEARLLRKLKHPAILSIIDAGLDDRRPYLVMEYAPRGSLRELLRERQGEALSLHEALRILNTIGQALVYAHRQNVFHRDLKPENILFNEEGEALLADFGMAVTFASAHTAIVGQGGTPAYMAPEQFEGLISPKSDQYSLACIAYELLSGSKPFGNAQVGFETIWFQHAHMQPLSLVKSNPTIPSEVERVIMRALAKDRAARYPSIADFLRGLSEPFFSATLRAMPPSGVFSSGTRLRQNASAARLKGEMLYADGRYQEAQGFFVQTLEIDKTDLHAQRRLGQTLFALGQHQKALEAFARALEMEPENSDYEVDQAQVLLALKQEKQALEACERALHLDPGNASAHCVQGKIYGELGLDEAALRCYDHAIELDPRSPLYHYSRGDALRWLGRDREALDAYNYAQALKPATRKAYVQIVGARSIVCYNLKRYDEALECCECALEMGTDTPVIHFYKGQALFQLQRYHEALDAFDRVIALDPEFTHSHANRGHTLYCLERFTEALEAFDRALIFDADEAAIYNTQGNIFFLLECFDEAKAKYSRAVDLAPQNMNYRQNLQYAQDKLAPEHF